MTGPGIDIRERDGDSILSVRVSPKASRTGVTGTHAGALKIAVTAPAEKGRANAAVVATLAKVLGVAKGQIAIEGSQTSRTKRICISGVAAGDVSRRIERLLS